MARSKRPTLTAQLYAQHRSAVQDTRSTFLEWTMTTHDLRRVTAALRLRRKGGPVFVLGFPVRTDNEATEIYLGPKAL